MKYYEAHIAKASQSLADCCSRSLHLAGKRYFRQRAARGMLAPQYGVLDILDDRG